MVLGPEFYLQGLPLILDVRVLVAVLVGTVAGIVVGALPGLTATMGVALLTPLTYSMNAPVSFGLLLGCYVGSIYGGSISAVLIRIPGTPAAVMTVLDGYPMAQRGEAGRALGIATFASFAGGMGSALFLAVFAPVVARLAFEFSAPEFFAVAVLGLSVVAYISPGKIAKGFLGAVAGLLVSTIGLDPITAFPRFTGGSSQLLGGVELIPVFVGIFGIVEILTAAEQPLGDLRVVECVGRLWNGWGEIRSLVPTFARAFPIGVFVGVVPAAGAAIASITAYGVVKRTSRHPERFGTGIPEGVAASETANNASTGGDMLPTITLGIPGDAVTAVLIGAFLLHGLQPGPMLFKEHADIAAAVILLMIVANVAMLGLGVLGMRLFAQVVRTPPPLLLPAIALLCVVGSYAVRGSVFDVAATLVFGLLGYGMTKLGIPTPPFVLGVILGPLVESNLRRALILSGGNPLDLFARPISATILVFTVLLLVSPALMRAFTGRHVRVTEDVEESVEVVAGGSVLEGRRAHPGIDQRGRRPG